MLSATTGRAPAKPVFESAHLLPTLSDTQQIVERRNALTSILLSEKNYFLRTANSILRNVDDAEDAVHSAFCSAWKAMATFRGDASLKTWFTRVVANAALSALRSKRTARTVFLEDNPDYMQSFELGSAFSVDDPEKILARKERLSLVSSHMESLPEETRTVLMLHFASDCSIDTIAKLRGKSRPSVAAHLHRGKAILRKKVQLMPTIKRNQNAVLQ